MELEKEAAKEAEEEEVRRIAEEQQRVAEEKQRQADEDRQLKIINLRNDATDRIDAAYDRVTKRELSFADAQAVETQVEQDLAQAIQELESGVEAGRNTAAGVHGDDMDLDATLVTEQPML
jgi:hypothetical protein